MDLGARLGSYRGTEFIDRFADSQLLVFSV